MIKIAIDGFDGTGKTTLINNVTQLLNKGSNITVERLIPSTVAFMKDMENRENVRFPVEFRLSAYIWETFIRLSLKNVLYKDCDYVFFDRWFFSYFGRVGYFHNDLEFYECVIKNIEKPNFLFLLKPDYDVVWNNLRKNDDWMVHKYIQSELKCMYDAFYERYEYLVELTSTDCCIIQSTSLEEVTSQVIAQILDD